MADEGNLSVSDAKLIQWLSEAHAKEAELEADLTAHIALTQKQAYRKRLQSHLKETRDHKRRVESRIKALGGDPSVAAGGPSIPGVPSAVTEVAGKAVAAVKGQVGTARAAVTEQSETHLRNAQEEFREEHVEIALYNRLEVLAEQLGDRETAQLAKTIRRDEERMAKFLDGEIGRLVKDVVKAEIPRAERGGSRSGSGGRSRRSSSGSGGSRRSGSSSRSSSSSSRRSSSSSRSSGSSRSSSGSSSSRGSRSSGSGSSSGGSRSSRSSSSSGSSRSSSSSRRSGSSRSSSGGSSSGSSSGSRSSGSSSSGSGSSGSGSSSSGSGSSGGGGSSSS